MMKWKSRGIAVLLCVVMTLWGTAFVFAEEDTVAKGSSGGGTGSGDLNIYWLDVGGTGLEMNYYKRDESEFLTVGVERFFDTGRSGFVIVNLKEKTVSPPLYYEDMGNFLEGMAAVATYEKEPVEGVEGAYVVRKYRCGYIDFSGKEVIPLEYQDAREFHKGVAIAAKMVEPPEENLSVEEDGMVDLYGLIDQQGKEITGWVYGIIQYLKDGYYIARTAGEQWGILKSDGSFQKIDCSYLTTAEPYLVAVDDVAKTRSYYDYEGEKLTPDFYNGGAYPSLEGSDLNLIPVMNRAGKWGFYDIKNQKMAIDYEYDDVSWGGFSEGLAGAAYESDQFGDRGSLWWKKMGYINPEGEQVIAFQYENVGRFSEGVAAVEKHQNEQGIYTSCGAIDQEGTEILPLNYSSVGSCEDGLIPVTWQESYYGFYNNKGEKLTPYKYALYMVPAEGVRTVGIRGDDQWIRYGAINRYGNEIIPMEYSGMTKFYEGRALIGRGFTKRGSGQISEEIGIIERPETADYDTGQKAFITVLLDGKRIEFDQDPMIVNGRTLAPMRLIFEAMGAEVEWDDQLWRVTAKKGDKTITLDIGKAYAYVNGKKIDIDVPAQIYGGRTLVPARFIAEGLDSDVDWDPEALTVRITTK